MSLIRMKQAPIVNSKGEPIKLTKQEGYLAALLQRECNIRFKNSLGYEIPITTLTTISKKISEQKFFEVLPSDYMPVAVGEGAFGAQLTRYREFSVADAFETGNINTGGQSARLAMGDAGVDALNQKIQNWAKEINWSIFDLEEAAKSGNWDLIAAKERARKKNWDLGIQKIAFLGAAGQNGSGQSIQGLLNMDGITNNTTLITKPISSMSTTELKAFQTAALEAYRSNCNRTAWPTHFIMPESDYNGLASQASADFPIKSTLQLLEEAFQVMTRNKSFKILPLAYGDATYNGLSLQQYVFLNYDEESLVMTVPVAYTNTLANSINNFQFQNVAYGQYTGVLPIRPLEVLYMNYIPS